jgi:uncharacterized protein YeaO (DUF488 family)
VWYDLISKSVDFIRHRKNITLNFEKFKKEFVKELEKLREMCKNQLEKENIKPLPRK